MKTEAMREGIAKAVLAEIPKLLTLLDRTPVSATYGCFDRAYWHYRILDFPCGMSQEFVLPLALVWSMPDIPGNPYYRDPVLRDEVMAAIDYAARSAHADGSCDDYYPFERAAGAAAFSLFAILGALEAMEIAPEPQVAAFLKRRARWLATHRESGRLSNHEALIVSCLAQMHARFPNEGFEEAMRTRLERLVSWQHEEGWFDEYGGADLGYLSLTIGLLSDLDRRRPDLDLRPAIRRAVDFLAHFVHPDGTVGGEYSSRSTLNFFPHGFEIAGAWYPAALKVNDLALRPLVEGRAPCYSDDHIIGHHLWSWLLTLKALRHDRFEEGEPEYASVEDGRRVFEGCSLFVERADGDMLVAALSRGGVLKAFCDGALVASDTGVTLRDRAAGKAAVCSLPGSDYRVEDHRIVVSGEMSWGKEARLTPVKNVILRILMLGFGRFFPDLVRRLLQKVLVTGKKAAPYAFERHLVREADEWRVEDRITSHKGWGDVDRIGISSHQTAMTTIMARVYAPSQRVAFFDLTERLEALGDDETLVVSRPLTAEAS
ncbi:hypothetical protein [Pararhizobium mangrovi]|uniref:hypothetical protein n=1 Tax=Pararhizobium mangrovi TaxID=2590452 RepID=UPI0015E84663|nr:hypothetical protein [Pararhizobium mangrovi]